MEKLKDGEPCNHVGCLNHATHPCEECGRIGGVSKKPPTKIKCAGCGEWIIYIPEEFDYEGLCRVCTKQIKDKPTFW